MNVDYRKQTAPGIIDANITELKQQADAFRTEYYLVRILDEAVKHLEEYRNLLRTIYIMDSNKEKFDTLSDRLPRGNR